MYNVRTAAALIRQRSITHLTGHGFGIEYWLLLERRLKQQTTT